MPKEIIIEKEKPKVDMDKFASDGGGGGGDDGDYDADHSLVGDKNKKEEVINNENKKNNVIILDEDQNKIITKISEGDPSGLKLLITQYKGSFDFVDQNEMTPLQYACYKKNKEIVRLLLDMGADVNLSKHHANYSALHFGALSGSSDICLMLLEAGANKLHINSVSRTAAQMAAFVGNHKVVATINNYIPKTDIEYYIKVQGLQTEPYLKPQLLDPLHTFIINSNMNPVCIGLNLQKSAMALDNLKMLKKVLDLMSEREMQQPHETNEVLSLKYHYLGSIVAELIKCRDIQETLKQNDPSAKDDKKNDTTSENKKKNTSNAEKNDNKIDFMEIFCRRMLKENNNGQLDYMETFIRECVRAFPHRECTLFRQIVNQLVSKEAMSALDIIKSAINGQRGFMDDIIYCSACGDEEPEKTCAKCKVVKYCNKDCQRIHWFMHKKACVKKTTTLEVADENTTAAATKH